MESTNTNTIESGNTVRTTRELANIHADRPSLSAGALGTVIAVNGIYARVDFDFDDHAFELVIPLAALELVDRPVDLSVDWNLIANAQRGELTGLTASYDMAAALYLPINAQRTR